MILDFLTCPKCGHTASLRLREFVLDKNRVRMECTECKVSLLVKPLDHPDRQFRKWKRFVKIWRGEKVCKM